MGCLPPPPHTHTQIHYAGSKPQSMWVSCDQTYSIYVINLPLIFFYPDCVQIRIEKILLWIQDLDKHDYLHCDVLVLRSENTVQYTLINTIVNILLIYSWGMWETLKICTYEPSMWIFQVLVYLCVPQRLLHRLSSDWCISAVPAPPRGSSWAAWAPAWTASNCSRSSTPGCTRCWCCRTWWAWCWSVAGNCRKYLSTLNHRGMRKLLLVTQEYRKDMCEKMYDLTWSQTTIMISG